MFRRFSANFAVLSIFLDGTLVALALYISSALRQQFNALPFVEEIITPVFVPGVLYGIFPLTWVGVLMLFSVYDGRRNLRIANELGSLTTGSVLAVVAMAGVLYLSFRDVSRFLFLFFALLAYLLLLIWRVAFRVAFRWNIFRTVQERKVLILGAGTVGRNMAEQIRQQRGLGLRLVGFLDDDPAKQELPEIPGTLEAVRDVVLNKKVDDIVIALPREAHVRLNQMVSVLHDLPVRVWVIPDYFSLALHKATVEDFAGIPMLDLRAPALDEYQRMVKRVFDLFITILALPIALPMMAIAALAIKLDSPGSIFYKPKRVGENGRLFEMIKFRTMVVGAEKMAHQVDEQGNILHKVKNDPRVTRVGRFLRKTSIDELPQIFNVLKGEMSLVGPRPEMPWLVDKYQPWQRKRFAVPQGITGWWQINGRSDKPMHLHTEDDLYYVQHYSIWLDLQILVKTVWAVLRGRGAF
jgi:exopolysaccharide biosynthesis polyprenyl glycosylphosphotransferase